MISLSAFKELTESEGLRLSDDEAMQARENLQQIIEIAFTVWIKEKQKSSCKPNDYEI